MRVKRFIVVVLLSLFLIQGVFVFSPGPARAAGREIYVDDQYHIPEDGTAEHPYHQISYAIQVANEGDTIYVYGGLYNETLRVTKRISIIGSIDEGATIVEKKAEHDYTISLEADFAALENVTVQDSSHYNTAINGALIHVAASNVIVQKNTCRNATCWALYLDSNAEDSTIVGNTVNTTRGISIQSSNNNVFSINHIFNTSDAGISILNSGNNILYGNLIENCSYGIYTRNNHDSNITNNTIQNTSLDAIYLYQDQRSLVMNNSLFDNVIGIKVSTTGSQLLDNYFDHNQIGISLTLSDNMVRGNIVTNSSSTGILADPWSHDNIFTQNHLYNNSPNARDSGQNDWEFNNSGNYWSDYNYIDRDHDGVGDIIYRFTTGQDTHPLGDFLKAPQRPSKPSPADDKENVGLKVRLWVHVNDTDSPYLTVSFFNAANDMKLGTQYYVKNNTNASCLYTFPFDTTFAWYVVSNDSIQENRSDIWFFTTRQRPPLNKKPIADPGGPYKVRVDQVFAFDGSGSYDPDSNKSLLFYRWNFGDGTSEILAENPTHNYSRTGIFNVTLTVVDVDGRSNLSSTTVTVAGDLADNIPPVAVIAPATGLRTNMLAMFNASGSTDEDGSIAAYRWDFNGDGIYEMDWTAGSIGSFVYTKAGSYSVTLQVKDDTGSVSVANLAVVVAAPPKKSPGFELAGVLAALAIAGLFLRKRK